MYRSPAAHANRGDTRDALEFREPAPVLCNTLCILSMGQKTRKARCDKSFLSRARDVRASNATFLSRLVLCIWRIVQLWLLYLRVSLQKVFPWEFWYIKICLYEGQLQCVFACYLVCTAITCDTACPANSNVMTNFRLSYNNKLLHYM